MSLTALLLLLASPAWAQDEAGYGALLDKAKAAITSGDYKGARALLVQAEAAAPASAALIQEKDLARLSFYKGAIEWRNGDKDTAALNHWRDAIVVSQDFQPEADVLPESDAQDVYYALIGEVKGRDSVTLGLPEDPGDTMIFVDGRRMEAFDAVVLGTHFLQLRCGEGNVVGSWYTFGAPPPDYLVLCSGGAYPVAKGGKAPKAPKGPSKAEIAKAEKEAAKQAALAAAAAEKAEKEALAAAAVEKAAADKAAKAEADKAAAALAAADKATADKAAADKLAVDKAAADKAATVAAAEKAAADKAAADKAAADKASAEKAAALAATDKAAADKAAADKAAADRAVAEKAAADKAASEKTAGAAAAAKAASDKAASDKAASDKAASDKATADKAAAEKAEKAAADKAAADKAAADKAAKALAEKPAKKPKAEGDDKGVVGWAMIAGGGAMIAGGGAINFLVVNPAWTEAEAANADPQAVNRAEADAIVSRFNTGRYATIGLIAAGVATAGVGVFLGPLDSHVYFTPTGVGLAGRW